jgi:hypothetical protein
VEYANGDQPPAYPQYAAPVPHQQYEYVAQVPQPQQYFVQVVYDHSPTEANPAGLSLRKGEIATLVETKEHGWCVLRTAEGTTGYFPTSYLTPALQYMPRPAVQYVSPAAPVSYLPQAQYVAASSPYALFQYNQQPVGYIQQPQVQYQQPQYAQPTQPQYAQPAHHPVAQLGDQKGICAICRLPVLDNQPRTKNQWGAYVHAHCVAGAGDERVGVAGLDPSYAQPTQPQYAQPTQRQYQPVQYAQPQYQPYQQPYAMQYDRPWQPAYGDYGQMDHQQDGAAPQGGWDDYVV